MTKCVYSPAAIDDQLRIHENDRARQISKAIPGAGWGWLGNQMAFRADFERRNENKRAEELDYPDYMLVLQDGTARAITEEEYRLRKAMQQPESHFLYYEQHMETMERAVRLGVCTEFDCQETRKRIQEMLEIKGSGVDWENVLYKNARRACARSWDTLYALIRARL